MSEKNEEKKLQYQMGVTMAVIEGNLKGLTTLIVNRLEDLEQLLNDIRGSLPKKRVKKPKIEG